MNNLSRLKPGVNKRYLMLLAGAMWMGVGIMLCNMAYRWLSDSSESAAFFYIPGIVAALVIHHFGFLRIVDRNLGRIKPMSGRRCIFSFMPWRSYLLVAVMMTMGIVLRNSSLPRNYLSVMYIAIGLSLFLSSIRYFRHFILSFREREETEQ
ncbi:MAG: hypothetical protein LC649_08115 [Bacteroidales bacterium]|nr:hypothetical protein [Bacteroidales bacterium]